jgi:hypothetical protein
VGVGLAQVSASPPRGGAEAQAERREAAGSGPTRPAARAQTAVELLRGRVPEILFEEAPLEEVLAAVGDLAGVPVVVMWDQLDLMGIERQQPISLRARNLRLGTLLSLILREAGGADVSLAYRATGEMIEVSTTAHFEDHLELRIYDVRDLVAGRIRRMEMGIMTTRQYVESLEPVVGNTAALPRPVTRWFNSGTFMGGDEWWWRQDRLRDDDFSDEARRQRMRELIDVITTVIEPESWEVNGGRGTIVPWREKLVVVNSPLVHQMIGGVEGGK